MVVAVFPETMGEEGVIGGIGILETKQAECFDWNMRPIVTPISSSGIPEVSKKTPEMARA
ncbi:MAG: hypothetical protein RLZZ244_2214 [Verrucomicrobiota bacterium]|jgi:hypothetical protein